MMLTSWSPENQAGSTCADKGRSGIDQLIGRVAAELPDSFGGQVQSVDVALTDQASVRVAGKTALRAKVAVRDEVLRLPGAAETETLELHKKHR